MIIQDWRGIIYQRITDDEKLSRRSLRNTKHSLYECTWSRRIIPERVKIIVWGNLISLNFHARLINNWRDRVHIMYAIPSLPTPNPTPQNGFIHIQRLKHQPFVKYISSKHFYQSSAWINITDITIDWDRDEMVTIRQTFWKNIFLMKMFEFRVKVQFRGPELFNKKRALFQDEFYLPGIFMPSWTSWRYDCGWMASVWM